MRGTDWSFVLIKLLSYEKSTSRIIIMDSLLKCCDIFSFVITIIGKAALNNGTIVVDTIKNSEIEPKHHIRKLLYKKDFDLPYNNSQNIPIHFSSYWNEIKIIIKVDQSSAFNLFVRMIFFSTINQNNNIL